MDAAKTCVQCGGSLPSVFNYCPDGQRAGKPSIKCHAADEPAVLPARERDHIEQFFAYAHLPAALQEVSKPFGDLAQMIAETLPRNPGTDRCTAQTA